jgi:DNA polymerase elongation subunit (family B)
MAEQKDIQVQKFLEGSNPKEYIVHVETSYSNSSARCIVHKPIGNDKYEKTVEKISFRPFIFLKDLKVEKVSLYDGDVNKLKEALDKYKIKITPLRTDSLPRMERGFKFLVDTSDSYNNLFLFFKEGGHDLQENKSHFTSVTLQEQFYISTGIRPFKGFNKYNDIHKLIFDIETTGLFPEYHRIFLIGMKDNKGLGGVLRVEKVNDDESERKLIRNFFRQMCKLEPAVVLGYNSEDFDFNFILKRAEYLNLDLTEFQTTMDKSGYFKIRRQENSKVKFGNEVHTYVRTIMWGTSVIDIWHAAKRRQKLDTSIKGTGLKYISVYEKVVKPDRMYVEGDVIFKFYNENETFHINKKTNKYVSIARYENMTDEEKSEYPDTISGVKIIDQYLLDDLEETEKVDAKYNESSFQLAKVLPTNFHRVCTIGGASTWSLIMMAWSYENKLAIPLPDTEEINEDTDISLGMSDTIVEEVVDNLIDDIENSNNGESDKTATQVEVIEEDKKEKIVGGLTRVFKIGYFRRIAKLDFAGLYPSIMLTRDIFPDVDVTDILKRLLLYFKLSRDEFKFLAGDDSPLPKNERVFYELKQAPLKVLNNSLFGALASGVVFKWGDQILAEEVTCCGRLYLRNLFTYSKKYGCDILLVVTDGVNLSYPTIYPVDINCNPVEGGVESDNMIYVNKKGKEIKGLRGIVEKFNEEELGGGYLKVDYDKEWKATLNVGRNNYVNLTNDDKLKIVGASIKSNVMPEYVEEFINHGLKLVMEDRPAEFVEYYYEYLTKIYNKQIPLKKIASKSNIKQTIESYKNRSKDKNGRAKAKQAHMELLIQDNIEAKVGETVYYVNIGTAKSHGNSKILKDKITKVPYMASKIVSKEEMLKNPNMTGDYNVALYLDNFNRRVTNLIIGFKETVKKNLLKIDPAKREYYTDEDLKLTNYDHDSIDEAITMSNREVVFWNTTRLDPRVVWNGFKNNIPLWYETENESKETIIQEPIVENKVVITKQKTVIEENSILLEEFEPETNIFEIILKTLNDNPNFKSKNVIVTGLKDKYNRGDLVLVNENNEFLLKMYDGNSLIEKNKIGPQFIDNALKSRQPV